MAYIRASQGGGGGGGNSIEVHTETLFESQNATLHYTDVTNTALSACQGMRHVGMITRAATPGTTYIKEVYMNGNNAVFGHANYYNTVMNVEFVKTSDSGIRTLAGQSFTFTPSTTSNSVAYCGGLLSAKVNDISEIIAFTSVEVSPATEQYMVITDIWVSGDTIYVRRIGNANSGGVAFTLNMSLVVK